MKLWIIGIILLVGSCACSKDDSYEIKRFHIQSRQLDGKPQCVEIRRKRSTREADYIKQIDIQTSAINQDDKSPEQKSIVDEDAAGDNLTDDIVIKRSDLAKSSAILIVESSSSPNGHIVFAMQPVSGNSNNNKNLKIQIFDDSNFSDDDDINEDFADSDDEIIDDDFEDYSEDYRESDSPKLRQVQTIKKSKKKQSVLSQIAESDGEDSMEYIVKPSKQTIKRIANRNRNKQRVKVLRDYLSQNMENYLNTVEVLRKLNNNVERSDLSPANCIVIEKEAELQEPPSPKEKSAAGLLSLDEGEMLPNKSYGLRKRYKGKRRQF